MNPDSTIILRKKTILSRVFSDWRLYAMILPAFIWLVVFCYVPMYGILMAFKNYRTNLGIWGSEWVGFKYFEMFFTSNIFRNVLLSTLRISIKSLLLGFPVPIIFALLVNRLKFQRFRKFIQMVSYMPNFISVVVIVSMLSVFFSSNGIFNILFRFFGAQTDITYTKSIYFDTVLIASNIWQTMGFGAIIYLAALSAVSTELYEAARIDGASTLQSIYHIDIPTILPTIIMLLILSLGSLLSVGHEKILLMQSGLNAMTSEIISTYVYKIGVINAQYGYSTAIGVFNSVINFALLLTANRIAKKSADISLF